VLLYTLVIAASLTMRLCEEPKKLTFVTNCIGSLIRYNQNHQ